MTLRDSVLYTVIRDEIGNPLPREPSKDRTIYISPTNFGFRVDSLGRPVTTGFGLLFTEKRPFTQTPYSAK
jgi:hypothetical protein